MPAVLLAAALPYPRATVPKTWPSPARIALSSTLATPVDRQGAFGRCNRRNNACSERRDSVLAGQRESLRTAGIRAPAAKAPTTPCDRCAPTDQWPAASTPRAGGQPRRNPRPGALIPLLGGDAERFGMGPAVMPGQDLADVARPIGQSAVADPAA